MPSASKQPRPDGLWKPRRGGVPVNEKAGASSWISKRSRVGELRGERMFMVQSEEEGGQSHNAGSQRHRGGQAA